MDANKMGMGEMMGEEEGGLTLDLDHAQLKEAGITALPEVGAKLILIANATVTKTELENSVEGTENSLCLRITKLEVKPTGGKDQAAIMFGEGE